MTETYATMIEVETGDMFVIRGSDAKKIPADNANPEWRDFQSWLLAGNQPTELAKATPVPSCALWQLEAVMTPQQLAAAQAAVAALNDPAVTAFWRQGTNLIPANSATLLALGQAMGLNAAQVRDLVSVAARVQIA